MSLHIMKGHDMNRIAITVPDFLMPKKDLDNPCPCQDRPVEMAFKKGILFWCKALNDKVSSGEIICEAEVEKKTVELLSPADGVLCELCTADGGESTATDILGYIDVSS